MKKLNKFKYFKKFPKCHRPIKIKLIKRIDNHVLRKPWSQNTPWKVAENGRITTPYVLKEPIPGVFNGSPPQSVLMKIKKERRIPLSDYNMNHYLKEGVKYQDDKMEKPKENITEDKKLKVSEENLNKIETKIKGGEQRKETKKNKTEEYSQPDYSQYGTYEQTTNNNSNNLIGSYQVSSVITVTPISVWANSRNEFLKTKKHNKREEKKFKDYPEIVTGKYREEKKVEDYPQIITAKYTDFWN